jgi:hypothetical protein
MKIFHTFRGGLSQKLLFFEFFQLTHTGQMEKLVRKGYMFNYRKSLSESASKGIPYNHFTLFPYPISKKYTTRWTECPYLLTL